MENSCLRIERPLEWVAPSARDKMGGLRGFVTAHRSDRPAVPLDDLSQSSSATLMNSLHLGVVAAIEQSIRGETSPDQPIPLGHGHKFPA